MQPCNRIYYSTVHWRLNTFRAAHRSSSGALTVFAASGVHTHVVTGRSQLRLDYDQSPHAYVSQRLQIKLELLMMSGIPLETCSAFNERWNNKFCYKVASCWLFLLNHNLCCSLRNSKVSPKANCNLLYCNVVSEKNNVHITLLCAVLSQHHLKTIRNSARIINSLTFCLSQFSLSISKPVWNLRF